MHTHTQPSTQRRLLPLSLGAAALLASIPGLRAQTEENEKTDATSQPETPAAARNENLGETVVLDSFKVDGGFRGSLAAATEAKKVILGTAEVVAAEDIGKLPDVSIADSLTRLTGLATQRINGRSQAISIRGFTGDFSTGLLNGREQVTTNSNRAVEFDQYPTELLSGAVVYKTTDASLIGQGLAGTVDLRTVRPLSMGRRAVAGSVFYEWTELGKLNAGSSRDGLRYSISYIDQSKDGKFGIAIGFAHAKKPGQGEQWNAWGYPNVSKEKDTTQPFVLGGAKPFVRSSDLKRDGLMSVLEFKPTPNIHSVVDLYYSEFDETQQLRGIEIPLWWSSAQLQDGFTVKDGLVTDSVFKNVFGVVRNDIVFRKAKVYSAGWNLKLGRPSTWQLETDLSYSKVDRTDTVLETYSGTGANQVGTADTMRVQLAGGTGAIFTPSLDYTDTNLVKLSSPQGWGGNIVPGGQVGYMKSPRALDELKQAKVSAHKKFTSFIDGVEFGVNFSDRSKSEIEDGFYLALADGSSAKSFTSIGVTDLSFIGIKGMASYDPLQMLGSGTYTKIRNPNADVVSVDWHVKEKVALAYAQATINSRLGRLPLTGNFGAQIIHTDQSSTGLAATGTGNFVKSVPVSGGRKYWDFVPSANLRLELRNDTFIRLSVARQLARQRMNDMRAGNNFGFDSAKSSSSDPYNSPWSGSAGNPQLLPWRANSIDISIEHYFADNKGYVSLAAFMKDLRTYTYTESTLSTFTGYPLPDGGSTPVITQGLVSRPVNGQGGKMKGLEATLNLPSELISKSVKGFGITLGGALTESSIQPQLNNPAVTLPGLSKKVASMTVYYERGGFSARVSQRYRSSYRANVSTFGPRAEDYRTVQAETVLDAQVSYAVQKGALKGVTFIVQGYNLTDEPLATFENQDARLVRDYQRYGATYSAGVTYKF